VIKYAVKKVTLKRKRSVFYCGLKWSLHYPIFHFKSRPPQLFQMGDQFNIWAKNILVQVKIFHLCLKRTNIFGGHLLEYPLFHYLTPRLDHFNININPTFRPVLTCSKKILVEVKIYNVCLKLSYSFDGLNVECSFSLICFTLRPLWYLDQSTNRVWRS